MPSEVISKVPCPQCGRTDYDELTWLWGHDYDRGRVLCLKCGCWHDEVRRALRDAQPAEGTGAE